MRYPDVLSSVFHSLCSLNTIQCSLLDCVIPTCEASSEHFKVEELGQQRFLNFFMDTNQTFFPSPFCTISLSVIYYYLIAKLALGDRK